MKINFAPKRIKLSVIGLLILSAVIPSFASGEQDIVVIQIFGNRRIEAGVIASRIGSKVGEPLSAEMVRQDIKSIYKLGFFEDVSAEVERTPDGLILIYRVSEKPVVVDIRIRGAKKIDVDDIEEVMDLREGRIIELAKVNKSLDAIKKLYSTQGYVGTEVDVEIEPKGEGTVSVIFDIKEGKKAFIKKVRFVGNSAIKSKKLKKGLYSKPRWFLSYFTERGLYNHEEIERDSDRIRIKYLDRGYIDVKVSKPEIEYDKDIDGFVVTFRIEENNRYSVERIDFSGDIMGFKDDLEGLLSLESDEHFSSAKLSADLTALTVYYGNRGYAFANVDPRFQKDQSSSTVSVTFYIEKGPEVTIRKIDIVGNTRTRDKVIRRMIPIGEQELFHSSKVQAIQRRVFRLGFFEDNIEIETERVEGTENELDIRVRVAEKSTGFFSIAGGFSSVETFIFAGQIQESNFLGYGKRLSLSAQIGGVTRVFLLNYQDPNFMDTDWTLETTFFNTDREFRDFERSAFGGSLLIGRRIWRSLIGRVSYRFERVDIGEVTGDARLIIKESSRSISSAGLGFVWDTRNNVLDPSKGIIARGLVEFAGSVFGGDTDFVRYTFLTRYFIPLPLGTVFTVSGRYGLIDLRNAGDDLVISERFFLGGPDSLRGFEFRRVGPRVPTDDGGFVIIGGTQEILFQVDFIFPLVPKFGLKGVLFFDAGNVFSDNEDFSLDPSDLRRDFGFGIKWVSPFGPLRLEVGFPIGKRLLNEDKYEVQFTVGNLF